jgi:DNA-binding NtrC family response regulator
MNILFIEDERELRESGVAQLELHGHTVYPVSDLAEAREVVANPAKPVKLVIADQSLPDGQGLHFIIEMKPKFTDCIYAIVSGCLTDQNIRELNENSIPYYHKPLLYGKLVEQLRREHMKHVPCAVVEAPEAPEPPEPPSEVVEPVEELVEPEPPKKRNKWFGFGK